MAKFHGKAQVWLPPTTDRWPPNNVSGGGSQARPPSATDGGSQALASTNESASAGVPSATSTPVPSSLGVTVDPGFEGSPVSWRGAHGVRGRGGTRGLVTAAVNRVLARTPAGPTPQDDPPPSAFAFRRKTRLMDNIKVPRKSWDMKDGQTKDDDIPKRGGRGRGKK
jgi:hypothetical protein